MTSRSRWGLAWDLKRSSHLSGAALSPNGSPDKESVARRSAKCKMFCTRLYLPVIIYHHRKIALAAWTSETEMTMELLSFDTTLRCSPCLRWDAAQGP
jgi:hypothetical protein